MKKILFFSLIISLLLLSGCFGGKEENGERKTMEGFQLFENSELTIQTPEEWVTLTSKKLPNGLPKNTLVAFRSNIQGKKFTSNIAVIKNALPEAVATKDYASATKEGILKHLISSKEIQSESFKVGIEGEKTETIFLVVEGRERADADLKKFMQTTAVKGKTAYVVTAAFSPDEEEATIKKIETAVKSFEVK